MDLESYYEGSSVSCAYGFRWHFARLRSETDKSRLKKWASGWCLTGVELENLRINYRQREHSDCVLSDRSSVHVSRSGRLPCTTLGQPRHCLWSCVNPFSLRLLDS